MDVIRETGYGCWVWEAANGEFVADGEQYMLVFGTPHDKAAVKAITEAAYAYGYGEGGKAVFWADERPVSDDEYDNQVARMEAGLTPDIWDIAAVKEDMKAIRDGR